MSEEFDPRPQVDLSAKHWEATVVALGRYRHRITFQKGLLAWGPEGYPGAGFVRWGFQRAERFARRTLAKLEARDERERTARTWKIEP